VGPSDLKLETQNLSRTLDDGRTFLITITFEKEIDKRDTTFKDFLSDYFFSEVILKSFSGYKRLGRKLIYSPERVINLKEHDIEIWQGFRYEVRTEVQGQLIGSSEGSLPMLNVDVDYLIVRLETALDVIREVRKAI